MLNAIFAPSRLQIMHKDIFRHVLYEGTKILFDNLSNNIIYLQLTLSHLTSLGTKPNICINIFPLTIGSYL